MPIHSVFDLPHGMHEANILSNTKKHTHKTSLIHITLLACCLLTTVNCMAVYLTTTFSHKFFNISFRRNERSENVFHRIADGNIHDFNLSLHLDTVRTKNFIAPQSEHVIKVVSIYSKTPTKRACQCSNQDVRKSDECTSTSQHMHTNTNYWLMPWTFCLFISSMFI